MSNPALDAAMMADRPIAHHAEALAARHAAIVQRYVHAKTDVGQVVHEQEVISLLKNAEFRTTSGRGQRPTASTRQSARTILELMIGTEPELAPLIEFEEDNNAEA